MTAIRWNRLLTALVVGSTVALAGSNAASAFFNIPLTPGHFKSSGAFAFAGMPDSAGDQASISMNYGQLKFRPKGGNGPLIQVNGTAVNVYLNMADGLSGFGCWLMNGEPITINSDLSASMTFDSSAGGVTPCPGFLVNQAPVSAAPQLSNLDQSQGLSGPVQFSIQWTPNQPLDVIHSVLNGTCQTWTSLEQISASTAFAAAGGTVSATVTGVNFTTGNFETESVNGAFSTDPAGFAQVSTQTDDEVVNGPATGSCGPYGQ